MELRQLHYFLQVCQYNSISQAAQSVFISPQALSKTISQLEEEFQMPLFSRTARGLILTEAGELLRSLGQPILESVTALSSEMSALNQRSRGLLSLGVTSTLDFFLKNFDFEEFQRTHNPCSVVFSEHSHIECEAAVASGAMVAALTYGTSDNPEVETIHLMNRQRVCLVSNDSPLAKKRLIHIDDLKGYDIVSSINSYSMQMFCGLCRERGFEPKIYRVDDITTMLRFCQERGYIGITIDYLWFHFIPWKVDLVAIPIAFDECYSPVNLIVNKTAYKQKNVSAVVSYIQQVVLEGNYLPQHPFEFQK